MGVSGVRVLARERQAPFASMYVGIFVQLGGEAGRGSTDYESSAPGVAIHLF